MNHVAANTTSLQITVQGIVQGVGFRPFVYRLAQRLALCGSVANNGEGVHIHLAGSPAMLDCFLQALKTEAPPIAKITRIHASPAPLPANLTTFTILQSTVSGPPSTQIAPDMALCTDCRREILDPTDRRFGYPFTNCTNCGPRFSIVHHIPYDRPHTSMRDFVMCAACQQEYDDPADRRFHAQPNACPQCGPQLSWHDHRGQQIPVEPLAAAALALAQGQVVAIKGLGGFHLAVDATNAEAVQRLRRRKRRPEKPLAVMVADLHTAERVALLNQEERTLLTGPEHPIVLVFSGKQFPLAPQVSPGLGILGLMLAYTPLHVLLFAQPRAPEALVMTSGNLSQEPICLDNEEALARLAGVADYFLLHNRPILTRVDDSVARVMAGKVRLVRRARGYAPVPLVLLQPTSDLLGCGAEMKNSFCLVRHQEAYLSQHIGELTGPKQFDFYQESVTHLQQVLQVVPAHCACDQHPDYLSSRFALARDPQAVRVQHHHAHIGAVMAEHNLTGEVLGLVLDGTGYGGDGTVFGGEIFQADRRGYARLAHLAHLPLPGGDRAAQEPWRMALALLYAAGGRTRVEQAIASSAIQPISEERSLFLLQLLETGLNCPLTSSCGRLFDAVSALIGLCLESSYEGQGAMLLEHQASLVPAEASGSYPLTCYTEQGVRILDSRALADTIQTDLSDNTPVPIIARRFHNWLIAGCTALVVELHKQTGVGQVVLAGGCMQNKLLLEGLITQIQDKGLPVYSGELVPMNDGGIAMGQVYIGGSVCA